MGFIIFLLIMAAAGLFLAYIKIHRLNRRLKDLQYANQTLRHLSEIKKEGEAKPPVYENAWVCFHGIKKVMVETETLEQTNTFAVNISAIGIGDGEVKVSFFGSDGSIIPIKIQD